MTHKETAAAFLQMCSGGQAPEAFQRFVGKGFKHHNVNFKGDAETLMNAMQQNAREHPKKTLLVKHVIEDGDLVAVHGHVLLEPNTPGVALAHIFRFERDRVVEMWDLGMPLPERSPNQHGAF